MIVRIYLKSALNPSLHTSEARFSGLRLSKCAKRSDMAWNNLSLM